VGISLSFLNQVTPYSIILKRNKIILHHLRKEKAAKAKAAGSTEVLNLQEPLMEVHVHGGSKRKVELSAKTGRSKDVKKVRAALLGPGSSSGAKGPKAGLIELLDTVVHHDIEINLSETLVNSIDNMEPNALVKAMVEFCSKALILGRRVGSLYQRELKEGSRSRVEELTEELEVQADKHAEEKSAWKKAREEWLEEKKRLGTWKVRCLDLENKLKGRIAELEEQLRRKMVDWSWSWRTLKVVLFKNISMAFKSVYDKRPFTRILTCLMLDSMSTKMLLMVSL